MTVETWILQHSESLALFISVVLWVRVETIRRQISKLEGEISVILTILKDERKKDDNRPPFENN